MKRYRNIYLIGIFYEILVVVTSCPYDPKICDCSTVSDTVICRGLKEMPQLRNGSDVTVVKTATFQGGNLTTIPDNSLPPGLINLEFSDLPITDISINAFQASANTLNQLVFANAEFRKLPDALIKLTNLTELYIVDTRIEDWNSAAIQQIGKKLQQINLSKMNLTVWPTSFSFFFSLTEFFVSDSVVQIPDYAFTSFKDKLTDVTLTNCNLTEVPKALSVLTNLNVLDLSKNNISDIQGRPGVEQLTLYPCAKTLKTLTLMSAGLTRFPDLSKMTNLRSIYFSNNHISDLAKLSFPPLIYSLDLDNNKLTAIPEAIANLSSLRQLSLSHNQITEVSLDNLPVGMSVLLLDSNEILNITDTFSTDSVFLDILSLSSNPISTIPPSAFRNLGNLYRLNIQHTNLTEVPLALTSLTGLKKLRISTLNCPSPPSIELVYWFNALSDVEVTGNCSTGGDIAGYLRDHGQTRPTTTNKIQPASTQTLQSTTPRDDATTIKYSVLCRLSCLLLVLLAYAFL